MRGSVRRRQASDRLESLGARQAGSPDRVQGRQTEFEFKFPAGRSVGHGGAGDCSPSRRDVGPSLSTVTVHTAASRGARRALSCVDAWSLRLLLGPRYARRRGERGGAQASSKQKSVSSQLGAAGGMAWGPCQTARCAARG
jgi:hypothetical protein